MPTANPKNILIAPLDWGLGHTTRCIPIIGRLRSKGCSVTVAGNEWQCAYLRKTFDNIPTLHLDGYNVIYGQKAGMTTALATQLPRLLRVIKQEHQWLAAQVETHGFGGVISDNRYGLYHNATPSVIITHQLQMQTGMGRFADDMLRTLHYKYLNRFGNIWVPDVAGAPNLAGALSHPSVLPANINYIGLLSQLEKRAEEDSGSTLILLSGPEPQRTILSQMLWQQAVQYKGNITFVEGSEQCEAPLSPPAHIAYHKRLAGSMLLPVIQQANMVICRSGYSTIMDLVALGKKAILIPTPGQTEQEYLARHLQQQGSFLACKQDGFDIEDALQKAMAFPYKTPALQNSFNVFEAVVDGWLAGL